MKIMMIRRIRILNTDSKWVYHILTGDIKKVMQQMFEGLFFIHNNKIIHRDMKAANILITRQVRQLNICPSGAGTCSNSDPDLFVHFDSKPDADPNPNCLVPIFLPVIFLFET